MLSNQKTLLATLLVAFIVLYISCRKFDLNHKNYETKNFEKKDAKEWYYGTFKKTADFKMTDENSPFTPQKRLLANSISDKINAISTQTNTYNKFPVWDKAIEYAYGKFKVVEMPLFLEENVLVLPGMHNATADERKKVADASLNKVLFIKNSAGRNLLRVVTIIPKIDYLRSKNFDISNNTAQHIDKKFSGFFVVRTWSNKVINFYEVRNGKFFRKINLQKRPLGNDLSDLAALNPDPVSQTCSMVWVPDIIRYCLSVGLCPGDNPCPDPPCEEWQEYDNGSYEYICEEDDGGGGGGGNPEDNYFDCLMGGGAEEYCACIVYGACEPPPGDGGGDDPPNDDPPVENPCDAADKLENNVDVKGKFELLKSVTNASKEFGFMYQVSSSNGMTNITPLIGVDGEAGINFPVTSQIDGIIHSHYTGLLSVFSPDDIYAMAQLYLSNMMVNSKEFTLGVVTASGTQYLLVIDDFTKFQSFASNLVNNSSLDVYSHAFENVFGIRPSNTKEQNEKAFLQYIQSANSGLKLFKGNSNFSEWAPIGVDSQGNVINNPC